MKKTYKETVRELRQLGLGIPTEYEYKIDPQRYWSVIEAPYLHGIF